MIANNIGWLGVSFEIQPNDHRKDTPHFTSNNYLFDFLGQANCWRRWLLHQISKTEEANWILWCPRRIYQGHVQKNSHQMITHNLWIMKMTHFERIKGWNEKSSKRISSCSRRSKAYSIYPARDWSIFGGHWPVYRHRWLYHWFQLLCPVIFMWPKWPVNSDRLFMTSNDLLFLESCQQLTVNFWSHPVRLPCTSIPMHWLMFYHQRQTHLLQCWVLMKSQTFHTGT